MIKDKNPGVDDSSKAVGASDFVTEAYNAKDPHSLQEFYAKWADNYDEQMTCQLSYISPKLIAQAMQKFLVDRDAKILDIGCGTGLAAKQMSVAGYTCIYGIDISREMVVVAGKQGIYTGLKVGDVNDPLEFRDSTFDGVISSGTFTHGHVGSEPLVEIFRILKPGGILACTVHLDLWQSRGFDQKFKEMQDDNAIQCLFLEQDRYYEDSEPAGWFCVYRKTAV